MTGDKFVRVSSVLAMWRVGVTGISYC